MSTYKLLQLNTVCNTSVGHLMESIQGAASEAGYKTITLYGRRKGYPDLPCIRIGNGVSFWTHVIWTTVTDRHGLASIAVTRQIIDEIRRQDPDIIHLHNLHGYYLNYAMLFNYLKDEFHGRIFWTLHDCWPFTGHCAFYSASCDRWKTGCHDCPHKTEYPISWILDGSRYNYQRKKSCFTGLSNLSIIVPSEWMKRHVEQSFLSDYPIYVVPNGIDFKIYYYMSNPSPARIGITTNKKIILGVAAYWTQRKGLNDFLELSRILPENYQIVLVGVSARQQKRLPRNVIGIRRTENRQSLVQLYSSSLVFINPSREESFSMVTVEAMACGLPVIALDTTAVKELIEEDVGIVLHQPSAEDYLKAIHQVESKIQNGQMTKEGIARYAQRFSVQTMTDQILTLYQESLAQ